MSSKSADLRPEIVRYADLRPEIVRYMEGLEIVRNTVILSMFGEGESSFRVVRSLTSREIGELERLGWKVSQGGRILTFRQW